MTFDPAGGTVSQTTKTVTYDQQFGTLPTPTKTGYSFAGWYNGSSKIDSTTIVKITSNTTITAHWNENVYTITLDQNGGTGGTTTLYEKYNTNYSLTSGGAAVTSITVPTRAGYAFNGYYTASSGGTQLINASGSFTTDFKTTLYASNSNIYARWQANKCEFTLAFNRDVYKVYGSTSRNVIDSWGQSIDFKETGWNSWRAAKGILAETEYFDASFCNTITAKIDKGPAPAGKWTGGTYVQVGIRIIDRNGNEILKTSDCSQTCPRCNCGYGTWMSEISLKLPSNSTTSGQYNDVKIRVVGGIDCNNDYGSNTGKYRTWERMTSLTATKK